MNPIKIALLATSACTMPSRSGSIQTPSPAVSPVEVVDLTPRFLAFYDSATVLHADTGERWNLWRSLYHFAAVPPTRAWQCESFSASCLTMKHSI